MTIRRTSIALLVASLAIAACSNGTSSARATTTTSTSSTSSTTSTTARATSRTTRPPATGTLTKLPVGFYLGTIKEVSASSEEMTYTITTSCSELAPGTYRIDLRGAAFAQNSDPVTYQGHQVDLTTAEFYDLVREQPPSDPGNADFWGRWYILVAPSEPILVADGPFGDCDAYDFGR
jgi:hypothetical protein